MFTLSFSIKKVYKKEDVALTTSNLYPFCRVNAYVKSRRYLLNHYTISSKKSCVN